MYKSPGSWDCVTVSYKELIPYRQMTETHHLKTNWEEPLMIVQALEIKYLSSGTTPFTEIFKKLASKSFRLYGWHVLEFSYELV